MNQITEETRAAVLTHMVGFVMRYSPVTAAWGSERVYEWLGWFLDHGLLFTIWHPNGHVIAMACIRLVDNPYEAAICENAYVLNVLASNVFVDFVLCHPSCKTWALKRLWSYIHSVVMTNSPQVTHVNWLRFNSTKELFRYPVGLMNAKLGDKIYG